MNKQVHRIYIDTHILSMKLIKFNHYYSAFIQIDFKISGNFKKLIWSQSFL